MQTHTHAHNLNTCANKLNEYISHCQRCKAALIHEVVCYCHFRFATSAFHALSLAAITLTHTRTPHSHSYTHADALPDILTFPHKSMSDWNHFPDSHKFVDPHILKIFRNDFNYKNEFWYIAQSILMQIFCQNQKCIPNFFRQLQNPNVYQKKFKKKLRFDFILTTISTEWKKISIIWIV